MALASDLRFGRWFLLFRRLPLVPVPLGVRSGKAKEQLYRYRATRGAGSDTSGGGLVTNLVALLDIEGGDLAAGAGPCWRIVDRKYRLASRVGSY